MKVIIKTRAEHLQSIQQLKNNKGEDIYKDAL